MTPKQDCPEGALVRDLGLGAVGPSVVIEAVEQLGCLEETVSEEILGQSPEGSAGP